MSRPERTRDPMVTTDVEHPVEVTTQCFDRGLANLDYLPTKRVRPSHSEGRARQCDLVWRNRRVVAPGRQRPHRPGEANPRAVVRLDEYTLQRS